MKVGDEFECPHCGRSSFLKKESVMDGWTRVGEVLKCALCSAKIEEVSAPSVQTPSGETSVKSGSALESLLGEARQAPKVLDFMKESAMFCRDCAHCVSNAFRMYCAKHDCDVNPMDDCPDFRKKTMKEEKKS